MAAVFCFGASSKLLVTIGWARVLTEPEIAVTDREHQILSDRPQDHLSGELPTHESLILPCLCCLSPSRHATASTRLDRQHKDATEP